MAELIREDIPMLKRRQTRTLAATLCAAVLSMVAPLSQAADLDSSLLARMASAAPDLNRDVLEKAFAASSCAIRNGVTSPERLAVIDFSLPSSEKRLWVFDLSRGDLVLKDLVAHGRNSGDASASSFSNREGSHQSSVGLFLASETYYGKHGYSLRMDGLEPGFNDHARQRAIVIHGADYVADSWIEKYGRIGRSQGCPAVRQEVIQEVVDNLKGGQLVFKYYPDERWLQSSAYLNCGQSDVAHANLGDAGQS